METYRGGVLVSRITTPYGRAYPGANHVAPRATKDEKENRTRSPPRRNRIFLVFVFLFLDVRP